MHTTTLLLGPTLTMVAVAFAAFLVGTDATLAAGIDERVATGADRTRAAEVTVAAGEVLIQ